MTNRPTTAEAPAAYARVRAELLDLARSLTDEQATTRVPMCPAWTVKDVYAHVVGINDDVLARRLEGIGTDEWTAVQVAKRSGDSLDDVCREWELLQPGVDAVTEADHFTALRMLADLVAHHLDILATVGREHDRDGPAIRLGLVRYGPAVMERVADAALPVLELVAGDQRWVSGDGEVAVSLTASPFEMFRVLTGRRSAAQTAALDWTGDPGPYLALLSPYGAADADVEE